MADKVMRIEGMTCAHCEKTVTEALTATGALNVVADWRVDGTFMGCLGDSTSTFRRWRAEPTRPEASMLRRIKPW